MKKPLFLVLALVLVFSLSACGGNSSGDPDRNNSSSSAPSAAYEKYTEMKSIAYSNLSKKISEHNELALSAGMAILPVAMIDLTLIPITLIGTNGGEAALGFLGMGNVNIEQRGDLYTITYTTSNSNVTQTCEYNAATNSLQSVLSETGKSLDSLVFEYAGSGNGYVSQYVMYEEESKDYTLYKMYFNQDGDMTIGIETVSAKPASIFKKSGLAADFAQNDSACFKLEGGKLTVFDDGKTKTY